MVSSSLKKFFVREAGAAGPRAREQWPSRMAYVLAAMGGAVGVGNLLRYPSQAAAHAGVQWFIPYLLALFVVGIPLLLLEISLGQAYQGGAVVAYNGLNCRLRGLGLGHSFIAFVTDTYYIAIMAYVLVYFRHSFRAPIPWAADNRAFFANEVHRAVDPVENATTGWISYPGTAVVGETLGWEILTWILVYLSIFRGVAITGKVVYLTMLLPLVMCIVLLVRSVTLSDARAGILQYIGKWNGASLRSGKIWSAAIRQIFFSIGTGFGYFIAYASFVNIHSNAVQDALIIALSNCLIEVIMGFAAFAVIGHLAIDLKKNPPSTFDIGFIAYPTAIAKMPGANVWAVFFFIIIYLLAIDSAFALAESFITVVTDSDWGSRLHKPVAVAICLFVAFLCSIPYCTQFGLYLLDAVDKWITGITLMFGSWLQCSVITSVYRYKDVLSQTGMPAFAIAQGAYFASMILGVILWQTVGPAAGGGMFVSLLVVGTVIATLMSKKPEVAGAWGSNKFANSFWWLTNYSVRSRLIHLAGSMFISMHF